jgi:hypothetical protein
VAGFKHCTDKLGYDGRSGDIFCEIKPKNVRTDDNIRLNAGGNFTDFTWRKYKKCEEDNVKMVMSGFIDGKLIFVLEFPFNNQKFKDHIMKFLVKFLPNGDEKNKYIRSCSWSFIHLDQDVLKVVYLKKGFEVFEKKITKNLFSFLKSGKIK